MAEITEPGTLRAGEYETTWFFGGEMRVTLEKGWSSAEDSTGEFSLMPVDAPEDGIFFWEDVYPVVGGTRVHGVPDTADGLVEWLAESSQVNASSPRTGSIGSLPATVVDVSLAPDAVNDERDNPYCRERTCALFLGFPQWDGDWGIAGSQVQRFYVADVTYGGKEHLFTAVVYPDDPVDLSRFAARAEPILASVRVPAETA